MVAKYGGFGQYQQLSVWLHDWARRVAKDKHTAGVPATYLPVSTVLVQDGVDLLYSGAHGSSLQVKTPIVRLIWVSAMEIPQGILPTQQLRISEFTEGGCEVTARADLPTRLEPDILKFVNESNRVILDKLQTDLQLLRDVLAFCNTDDRASRKAPSPPPPSMLAASTAVAAVPGNEERASLPHQPATALVEQRPTTTTTTPPAIAVAASAIPSDVVRARVMYLRLCTSPAPILSPTNM